MTRPTSIVIDDLGVGTDLLTYIRSPPPDATAEDIAEAGDVLDEESIVLTGQVHRAAELHSDGGIHSSFWADCGALVWADEATDDDAEVTCSECIGRDP